MILGDEIAAILPELRTQAESLMVDVVTITVPGEGDGVYDEATNITLPPAPVQVYAGPARIQVAQLSSDKPLVAVDQLTVVQHIISIPVGAAVVPKAARITITASAHDPANIGRVFAVRAVLHKTHATALRMSCEQIQVEAS